MVRKLAASFIVTASLAGCTVHTQNPPPEEPHRNPPGPIDEQPPVDATEPGTPETPQPEPQTPEPVPPVEPDKPELPEANEGWDVKKKADGTCWAYAQMDCPPQATCNPPPPMQVKCPD